MSSLYAQYIKERENFEIIEDEFGYATYRIVGEECYVRDVFVLPECRQKNHASGYVDKISEIAKTEGCTHVTTTVSPLAEGATTSLKAILGYGFKLLNSKEDRIVFVKEITNG